LAKPFSRRFEPLVGRSREPGVARHRSSISKLPRQDLPHQHVRRLDADTDHPGEQARQVKTRDSEFVHNQCDLAEVGSTIGKAHKLIVDRTTFLKRSFIFSRGGVAKQSHKPADFGLFFFGYAISRMLTR
jgi:hypothetical protein